MAKFLIGMSISGGLTLAVSLWILFLESRFPNNLEEADRNNILIKAFSRMWGPFVNLHHPPSSQLLVGRFSMKLSRISELPSRWFSHQKNLASHLFPLVVFLLAAFLFTINSSHQCLGLFSSCLGFFTYRLLYSYRRLISLSTRAVHVSFLLIFFLLFALVSIIAAANGYLGKSFVFFLPLSFFSGAGVAWPWSEFKQKRETILFDQRYTVLLETPRKGRKLHSRKKKYFERLHTWRYRWPTWAHFAFLPLRLACILRIITPTKDYFKIWACLVCENKDYHRVITIAEEGNRVLEKRGKRRSFTLDSFKVLAWIHLGDMEKAERILAEWKDTSSFLLYNQTYLLWQKGNFREGIDKARDVINAIEISLNSDNSEFPRFQAIAAYRLAAQLCCESILDNPSLSPADFQQFSSQARDYIKKAKELLNKISPRQSRFLSLIYTEGLLHLHFKEFQDAASCFARCVESGNHKGAQFRLAILAMIGTPTFTHASDLLQTLVEQIPKRTKFHEIVKNNLYFAKNMQKENERKEKKEKKVLTADFIRYHESLGGPDSFDKLPLQIFESFEEFRFRYEQKKSYPSATLEEDHPPSELRLSWWDILRLAGI